MSTPEWKAQAKIKMVACANTYNQQPAAQTACILGIVDK
jgi:hypothetical protein